MIQEILNIVATIKPISLEDMDSVKLLNRTDTKYLFEISKLPFILQDISDKYCVLHIENNPLQDYETIYFDTKESDMYHAHQNGKCNRYKVRHRTYLSTHDQFLEIKFKNNKGRTIKKRIPFNLEDQLHTADPFLMKHTPFKGDDLLHRTLVNYSRITLVDLINGERATIDINLAITDCETKEHKDFSFICIIELKRDKSSHNSPMQEALKKHRVFSKGMSKYSIGTASINTEVRVNRFKKKLRFLDKLKSKN